MKKVNWKIFEGSSHCEEGLARFATGDIASYKEFKKYFLPMMRDCAREVDIIKGNYNLKQARIYAGRAFKRIYGVSITETYGSYNPFSF